MARMTGAVRRRRSACDGIDVTPFLDPDGRTPDFGPRWEALNSLVHGRSWFELEASGLDGLWGAIVPPRAALDPDHLTARGFVSRSADVVIGLRHYWHDHSDASPPDDPDATPQRTHE